MKAGFKRTVKWNKYHSEVTIERQNQYLDYLIDPCFQVVNRLFVLSFENDTGKTGHSGCFLRKVEIGNYNVMIDGENFFDQWVKNWSYKIC